MNNYFSQDQKDKYKLTRKQRELLQDILHSMQLKINAYKATSDHSNCNIDKATGIIILMKSLEEKYKIHYLPPREE